MVKVKCKAKLCLRFTFVLLKYFCIIIQQQPNILQNFAKCSKLSSRLHVCPEDFAPCMRVPLCSACTAALWHHPVSQHGFRIWKSRGYFLVRIIQRKYLKPVDQKPVIKALSKFAAPTDTLSFTGTLLY